MGNIRFEDHSDNVHEKFRLLEKAYASKNYDLALSLSESIKDTLTFERQVASGAADAQISSGDFIPVDDLPETWSVWARGWKYCKPLTLFETVGIARSQEPVDLSVAFRADQTSDLRREVRVARLESDNGSLREIPSQVYDEVRRGKERRCRIVFFADVPTHGQAAYLVFYGNPNAELPAYTTDLQVEGEGYDLKIANNHFVAKLSSQMGQLERMTYKREHGLELFAGGKGHGEPPTIDWAHDYVDEGNFQKLRMRSWPNCPNYEVVRGPLCVRVRRWGFPYSPLHPVFTPSRIHADQTYIFYAGVPYFFKQGRMEAIQDVRISAMRDDEWVFSGYSFTETVWFDRAGKLHEGRVPPEHAEDLWGVGYFHRDSRDAFVAIWLEHTAEKLDALGNNGVPTLHYHGHGQVWARYPAHVTVLAEGASVWQKNAYVVSPFPIENASGVYEQWRHQFLNPLGVRAEIMRPDHATPPAGSLARFGETAETAPLKPRIWETLAEVKDEQLYSVDANIVDLGYIYDVRVRDGVVHVVVTMPHRGRPVYDFLVTKGGGRVEEGIRERLLRLDGVREVVIHFTWEPPWDAHRMTDAARKTFGLE